MLDAKRTLLLAISHELRSPLTRARVNAELLDDGPERQALLRDLAEMGELISSLLESERLAAGHRALARRSRRWTWPRWCATWWTGCHRRCRDAATGRRPVPRSMVDATRLRLLLRNLLDNTRRHAAGAATQAPELFLRHEADGQLALGVRDHGPGVPESPARAAGAGLLPPDSARTREAGGVGLGLYLCRLVAQGTRRRTAAVIAQRRARAGSGDAVAATGGVSPAPGPVVSACCPSNA
jgi:signal transduction histidine kinase